MDEGLPIAYPLLEKDVPVYAAGGEEVGKVHHVVAAPELDIFHGVVIQIEKGQRFVPAEMVASLHERGVDLSVDASTVGELPEPHGGAAVWRAGEPGIEPTAWRHLVDRIGGHAGRDGWQEKR
jgi:hypothetical protein